MFLHHTPCPAAHRGRYRPGAAVLIDDPQIHDVGLFLVHVFKMVMRCAGWRRSFSSGCRPPDGAWCSVPAKLFDKPSVIGNLLLESVDNTGFSEIGIMDVQAPSHQQKGHNGTDNGEQGEPPEKIPVGVLFGGIIVLSGGAVMVSWPFIGFFLY